MCEQSLTHGPLDELAVVRSNCVGWHEDKVLIETLPVRPAHQTRHTFQLCNSFVTESRDLPVMGLLQSTQKKHCVQSTHTRGKGRTNEHGQQAGAPTDRGGGQKSAFQQTGQESTFQQAGVPTDRPGTANTGRPRCETYRINIAVLGVGAYALEVEPALAFIAANRRAAV